MDTLDTFDPHQMQCLHDNDMPMVAHRMLELFQTHTPEVIAMMREALDTQDMVALRRAIIRLRGSSAAIGGEYLAGLCETGEHLLDDSTMSEFPDLIVRIEQAYETLRIELQDVQHGSQLSKST